MLYRFCLAITFQLLVVICVAQLPVARDTITVLENGHVLRHPWAGGINYVTVSNADLNADGSPDLVFFEKQNTFGIGKFRCFLHVGNPGTRTYRHDPGLSYYFPQLMNWAILRDFDLDGRADIFCSTSGGIKVYRNVTTPQNTLEFELFSGLLHSNYFPAGTGTVLSNLYAGSSGVPGFADVDNDLDLDILTFTPLGIFLELHRNMSRERFGTSDSLVFQRDDNCWGDLSESECTVNFDLCSSRLSSPAKTYHAGSCITCLDSDGDLDQDLLMGDMTCSFVHYVHNTGTATVADFTDTTRLYPNYPAKNSTGSEIRISYFPCAYVADADADGRQDLFASPNAVGSENFNSLWLYRNTSSTSTVNFQLLQKNFLQDEMIDVGQNAFPLLFDENADGLKDLVVGTYGYYNAGLLTAKLALYRNTGTAPAPFFSLVTRDYLGIASSTLSNAMPAAGDVDGDGDTDLLVGTSSGRVHWLENIAGAGQPCVFAPIKINPFNFTTPSAAAAPQLFDLDEDGKADLLIGMKNGRVAFYRNTSAGSSVTFSLVTSTLGGIDVKADPAMYGLDAYAVPFFFRDNNVTRALIGSVTGDIWQYDVPTANSGFGLITPRVNGLSEGSQSSVCYEDINNDGKRDLFIGQASGGLSFFSSASAYVGAPEYSFSLADFILQPNPATDKVNILCPTGVSISSCLVFDIAGKECTRAPVNNTSLLDVSGLAAGVYLVRLKVNTGVGERFFYKKLVRQN